MSKKNGSLDETTKKAPKSRRQPPARTLEGRENQLIAYAVDLAEKQLREGTASSQVITHYLKLGSTKERYEKAILKEQAALMRAKTKALESAQHSEELYAEAIAAFKKYSGAEYDEDPDGY